jgi:hypothetical protein
MEDCAQGSVDFGASEIGYSTNQSPYDPPPGTYQYVPDAAGAYGLMYNLRGNSGRITQLHLESAALAGIFTGTITNWRQLQSLQNPGIKLPNSTIYPVTRSDASGDNDDPTVALAIPRLPLTHRRHAGPPLPVFLVSHDRTGRSPTPRPPAPGRGIPDHVEGSETTPSRLLE